MAVSPCKVLSDDITFPSLAQNFSRLLCGHAALPDHSSSRAVRRHRTVGCDRISDERKFHDSSGNAKIGPPRDRDDRDPLFTGSVQGFLIFFAYPLVGRQQCPVQVKTDHSDHSISPHLFMPRIPSYSPDMCGYSQQLLYHALPKHDIIQNIGARKRAGLTM